jgi:flagellar basal-body rod protein FlgF
MDATGYTTLTRQTGLLREMQIIANNIANANTTGFRQEGLIFSEYVQSAPGMPSVSMASGNVRNTSLAQGALTATGSQFDFAIEGDGFFLVQTPDGDRLTRAGNFSRSADGELVTSQGHRVLDVGGAPLFIPPDVGTVDLGRDGSLSASGRLIGQIGVVQPTDPTDLTRETGLLFRADAGVEPVLDSKVVQGFLEGANVNPILQFARMVEVQRAYEMGQSFLDAENERLRTTLDGLTK